MSFDAMIGLHEAPPRLAPSASFTPRITLRNTGSDTWTPGTTSGSVRLSSINEVDNTRWGTNRLELQAATSPGALGLFTGTLTAPSTPGYYGCDWRLVHEGDARYGPDITLGIHVGPTTRVDSTQTPPAYDSGDPGKVFSFYPILGSPQAADNHWHAIRWTNATGRRLWLERVYVWLGVQMSKLGDFHAELTRLSDGSVLGDPLQWDRYAEPTAPDNHAAVDLNMTLDDGDAIDLNYYGMKNGDGLMHPRALVRFSYGS